METKGRKSRARETTDEHSRQLIKILRSRLNKAETELTGLRSGLEEAVHRAREEGAALALAKEARLRTRSLDSQRRAVAATVRSMKTQHQTQLHRLQLAKDTELRGLAAQMKGLTNQLARAHEALRSASAHAGSLSSPSHTAKNPPSPTPSHTAFPATPPLRQLKAQVLELQSRLAAEVGRGRQAEATVSELRQREAVSQATADGLLRELRKKEIQLAQFSERLDKLGDAKVGVVRDDAYDMLKRPPQTRKEERRATLPRTPERRSTKPAVSAKPSPTIHQLQAQLSRAQQEITELRASNTELAQEVRQAEEAVSEQDQDTRALAALRSAAAEKDRRIEALQQKLRRIRKAKGPMRLGPDEETEEEGAVTTSMSLEPIDEDLEEISKEELEANYKALASDHVELQKAFQALKEEQRSRKREDQLERQLEAALGRLATLQLESSTLQHSASLPSCMSADPRVPALQQALQELQESREGLSRELQDLKEANELLEFQVLELEQQREAEAEEKLGVGVSEDEGVGSGLEVSSAEDVVDHGEAGPDELRVRLTLLKHRAGLGAGERSLVGQVKRYLDWLEAEHSGCKRERLELELRCREREGALRAQLAQLSPSLNAASAKSLRNELETKAAELSTARAELDELRDVEDHLRAELKKAHSTLADQTSLLHQSHERIKELEVEVGRREADLGQLEAKVVSMREKLSSEEAESPAVHEECRQEIHLLRAEKLSLLNELQTTTSRLQSELSREGGRKGRRERVAEDLALCRRKMAELEAQLALQTQLAAGLKAQLSATTVSSTTSTDSDPALGRGLLQLLCNCLSGLPSLPADAAGLPLLETRAQALASSLAALDGHNGRLSPEARALCDAVAALLAETVRAARERAELTLQVAGARRRASMSEERALALGRQHHASVVALGRLQKKTRQLEANGTQGPTEPVPAIRPHSHSATLSQSSRPQVERLLLRTASSESCATTIVLSSPPLPGQTSALSPLGEAGSDGSATPSEADSGHHGWSSIEVNGDGSIISSSPPQLSASSSTDGDAVSTASSSTSPPLPPPPPPKTVRAKTLPRPALPPKPANLATGLGASRARLSSSLSKGTHFLMEWESPRVLRSVRGYKIWLGGAVYKWLPGGETASALVERSALVDGNGECKRLSLETILLEGTAPTVECCVTPHLLASLQDSFDASKTQLQAHLSATS